MHRPEVTLEIVVSTWIFFLDLQETYRAWPPWSPGVESATCQLRSTKRSDITDFCALMKRVLLISQPSWVHKLLSNLPSVRLIACKASETHRSDEGQLRVSYFFHGDRYSGDRTTAHSSRWSEMLFGREVTVEKKLRKTSGFILFTTQLSTPSPDGFKRDEFSTCKFASWFITRCALGSDFGPV